MEYVCTYRGVDIFKDIDSGEYFAEGYWNEPDLAAMKAAIRNN